MSLGNWILLAAFALVALVGLLNFRILKTVLLDTMDTSIDAELPIIPVSRKKQGAPSLIDLNSESIHTFVVWTYPSKPDFLDNHEPILNEHEVLLCSYPPCGAFPSQRLNLRILVQNTTYQSFVTNHAIQKVSQQKEYLHHVQSVALLCLVRKYPSKCARTWGADESSTVCGSDLPKYARYDPVKSLEPAIPVTTIPSFSGDPPAFHVFSYDSRIKLLKEANMEDELQSLAAAQFCPHVTSFVDRDTGLASKIEGHLLANARFRTSFDTPKSLTDMWDTTLTSIQLRNDAKTTVEKRVWLFKGYTAKSGAIGAEDEATLDILQGQDIQSYLALSFTLLLGKPPRASKKRKSIVLVDVKSGLLPPAVEKNAIKLQRTLNEPNRLKRLQYANKIIDTFANEAKVVITSRIQVALPATAMRIPVIYVGMKDYLQGSGVGGDMFHVFDPYNGDTWTFDLDKLPPSPQGVHRADRARASFWNVLKRASPFYTDTAHLYGMVPLQRIGRDVWFDDGQQPLHDLFHFIITTPPETLTWREKRAIEHVFYFHPNAKVILHSNTLTQGDCELDIFGEVGYDFTIQPYSLADMLQKTVANKSLVQSFLSNLDEFRNGDHWYSHETDIFRYMLLWHSSGVYLDTDMYLIKPLPKDMTNVLAYQDAQHDYISGAVMIFHRKHALLQAALEWTLENYAAHKDEWPVLGSSLMTLLNKEENMKAGTYRVLDDATFYPIDWESIDKCFTQELADLDLSETFAVHLNTKITSHYTSTTNGTFCDKLLHAYCIFCDEIHTIKGAVVETADESVQENQDYGFGVDHDFALNDGQHRDANKAEHGPSFFSKFISGLFGGKRNPPPVRAVPVEERKALPPVHMEFVKNSD